MGSQYELLKQVDAIKEGDYVVTLENPRLYQVWNVEVEYDYGQPHAVWLKVIDVATGDKLTPPLNGVGVSLPLTEMEVLAWVSE